MKKPIKRTLFGLAAIVLLIVLFFAVYMIKVKSILNEMTPLETKNVMDNVYAIQDSFCNMFLIEDNGQYIAIDAGNSKDNISEGFEKLNINPENVTTVFLTHTDGDHVAALSLFENAKVYISRSEEQLLNGEKSRFLFFGNSIDTDDYALLDDQQILQIGNTKIKGILTPGHTPGSMCYLINDKYLFVGDALSIIDGNIEKLNSFFNVDTEMAVQSMEIIKQTSEAEYIFSAHYGYTKLKH